MNLYVSQWRDMLKLYHNKELALAASADSVIKMYTDEFQEYELGKIRAQSEAEYDRATEFVRNSFLKVREYLSNANTIDPTKLTADKALFTDGNFKLNREEIQFFISKHKDNPTMLRLISDYLDTHGDNKEYAGIHVNTSAEKLRVYQQFGNSCLDVMRRIHFDPRRVSAYEVEHFADEDFASELYEKIGSGMNLDSFKSAHHNSCFDAVNLTA